MSLNKFMHPKNPYKIPPNFKELAVEYPDFRQYIKQTITGKVVIDFKDQNAIRSLSSCLLQRDFQLTINLPLGRLIPTLPLRLNYLLWVQDLIQLLPENFRDKVVGIDIGTGSSCIYPLMGTRRFQWRFLATEADPQNYDYAQMNVLTNKLEDSVKVIKVNQTQLLENVVGHEHFTFTMCNPPFYGQEQSKNRNNRPSPTHSCGGEAMEIAAEGGEAEFVSKIIEESKTLGDRICIFTTMLGHKSSVKPIKRLIEAAAATNLCTTEFCQGRTMRWGVAWTFQNVPLEKCPCVKRDKSKAPVSWIVPENYFKSKWYNVKAVDRRVLDLLNQLKLLIEPIRSNKYIASYTVTASENTWIHQRRKRREEQRLKKLQMEGSADQNLSPEASKMDDVNKLLAVQPPDDSPMEDEVTPQLESIVESEDALHSQKRTLDEDGMDEHDSKRLKSDDSFDYSDELESEVTHIARFKIAIQKTGPSVGLTMDWIDGTGGVEVLHQILVYLKNQLAAGKPPKIGH